MVEATLQTLTVPFSYRKIFNPEQCTELVNAFKTYDKNKDGTMDAKEFKQVLKDLGYSEISADQVDAVLKRVDKNSDSVIDFEEYLEMFASVKAGDKTNFGDAIDTKGGAAASISGTVGSQHTYLIEERSVCARMVNKTLEGDELLSDRLPMNADSDDLFHVMSDGMVLLRLLNAIDKELIDMRAVNKGNNLGIFKVKENLNMALTACKGRIKVVGINDTHFLEKKPHLILAVLTQLVKLIAHKTISLQDCPEIMRLAEEGEELSDLLILAPEKILLRWVNFHLKAAGQPPVGNLGKDLKDCKALLYVTNQLDKSKCSLAALSESEDVTRADHLILNAQELGVKDVASAVDLTKGNSTVNTIFVAELFNANHGLKELTKAEYDAAAMGDEDNEGSREERAFRLWINSLGIMDGEEQLFCRNIYEEARDGLLLLKVIHRINPTVVEWNRVEKNPNNTFKKGINC